MNIPEWYLRQRSADISDMLDPVECLRCTYIYDTGKVTVVARYLDCSMWRCPGCNKLVDDRPLSRDIRSLR